MTKELMNEIIKYLMDRPYAEVYLLMDKVRSEVERINAQAQEQKDLDNEPIEEVVNGD